MPPPAPPSTPCSSCSRSWAAATQPSGTWGPCEAGQSSILPSQSQRQCRGLGDTCSMDLLRSPGLSLAWTPPPQPSSPQFLSPLTSRACAPRGPGDPWWGGVPLGPGSGPGAETPPTPTQPSCEQDGTVQLGATGTLRAGGAQSPHHLCPGLPSLQTVDRPTGPAASPASCGPPPCFLGNVWPQPWGGGLQAGACHPPPSVPCAVEGAGGEQPTHTAVGPPGTP